MRRLLLLVFLVTACGGAPTVVVYEPSAAPVAGFDLAAVKANFTDECKDPAVVDELFCTQVKIAEMTADDDILNVPTTLAPEADDRAYAICDQLATDHFEPDGDDLGYNYIGILDMNGGNLAACSLP